LPGAHRQTSLTDRNAQLTAQQAGLEVCRKIVRPLVVVLVARLAIRHQAPEEAFEITAHRRVGVLVHGQRGGGVLQPEVQQTDPTLTQLRKCLEQLVGDQVKAPPPGCQLDRTLQPHAYPRSVPCRFSGRILASRQKKQRAPKRPWLSGGTTYLRVNSG